MDYNYQQGPSFLVIVLYIVAVVFYLYCSWKIFEKAAKPGWASIIPIYNTIVGLEIIGRPWWWLFLLLIPIVDIVIGIIMVFELAKVFGRGTGFGFGLLLLPFIFIPILALDDSRYLGPLANS
ncbi:MAG: DUF5684 domain-containing protein [Anaerolineaceae bacterium]|jgi:ABC-type sulfate transport system permease subunit